MHSAHALANVGHGKYPLRSIRRLNLPRVPQCGCRCPKLSPRVNQPPTLVCPDSANGALVGSGKCNAAACWFGDSDHQPFESAAVSRTFSRIHSDCGTACFVKQPIPSATGYGIAGSVTLQAVPVPQILRRLVNQPPSQELSAAVHSDCGTACFSC